ncbi:MAG: hypothetical protein K2L42_03280 [Clostridia bacterium]|nr:hypothetical protein [Clostridia bacterium]
MLILPVTKFTTVIPQGSPAKEVLYEDKFVEIIAPDGKHISINGETGGQIVLNTLGTYEIKYTGVNAFYVNSIVTGAKVRYYSNYSFYYIISVVENHLPLKPWTITEVINRTLDLAEPIRKGEKPRFKLNAAQAQLFNKILAPQFSFTKQTLRECLQEIGKVVHGEPRLEPKKDESGVYFYEVSYDMFAAQEKSGIWTKPYILKTVSQVIDSYTAWLDSNAENLVNQLDKYSGVIVEPYRGGAKTVRTENLYVRIEEGNMLIPTQYPIYTVDKLEYVYVENNELKSVDITPWLFERSIYDTELSSYAEQYPYSKAYALWFSQGSKNIQGLNFKVDAAVAAVFKNYAITNILHQVIGPNYTIPEYPTMAFRVTYTPFYNARVAQTKPNYKEFNRPAALIFNQQANIVESRYYGENLKGAVARIGNIDLSLTYRLYFISDIPQAGQMYDDNYYISAISVEYLPTCILCTIGLSRDFNRLSAYIGINSEKRYSEVSQTQAVERNTLWREYIVVGNAEQADDDSLIGQNMLHAIAATFTQDGDYMPLTNVAAWGQSYNGNDLNVVNLPVISSAFGNSISFSWTYEDNYSAGAISHYENKKDGAQGYFQNNYPYNDYYGRMYYYNFDIQPAGEPPTAATLKDIGTDLPKGTKPLISSGYLSTIGKTPFVMRKDNREVLQCNFQIDFVTNTDIIIGSALASYCPAVRSTDKKFIKEETFSNGEVYIGSNGQIEPYEMGKTYLVLVDNMTYVNAFVESRVDETSPANDEYYLVISEYSNYKNFQGTAKVYEGTLTARLYVFPTELNKFTDHIEAWENVDLWWLPSEEVQVIVSGNQFLVQAAKFPASGKSWAIVTSQSELPPEEVENEEGEPYQLVQTIGGDLLIGQNKEVTAGQAFTPIYFTKKREIFDKTVWKDVV